jgi:hypothetical protein
MTKSRSQRRKAVPLSARSSAGHGSARTHAAFTTQQPHRSSPLHRPGHPKKASPPTSFPILTAQPALAAELQLSPAHGQFPIVSVRRRPIRAPSRGFVPWRFSDAGRCPCGNVRDGRHLNYLHNTRRTHYSKVPYVFDDLVRARKQHPWNGQSKRFSAALERHAKSGVLGQRSAISRSPAPAGDTSTPGPSTIDRLGALAIKFRALRAKRAIC